MTIFEGEKNAPIFERISFAIPVTIFILLLKSFLFQAEKNMKESRGTG
jgi:hypothetical protein